LLVTWLGSSFWYRDLASGECCGCGDFIRFQHLLKTARSRSRSWSKGLRQAGPVSLARGGACDWGGGTVTPRGRYGALGDGRCFFRFTLGDRPAPSTRRQRRLTASFRRRLTRALRRGVHIT
jgi:hypothetical protein